MDTLVTGRDVTRERRTTTSCNNKEISGPGMQGEGWRKPDVANNGRTFSYFIPLSSEKNKTLRTKATLLHQGRTPKVEDSGMQLPIPNRKLHSF